jgi:TonB family protein
VAAEALEEELRRELVRNGSETVLIRGDKEAYLDRSRDIMALARRAGARNVAILAEGAAEGDQAPAGKRGTLDKALIGGVVRDHLGEIKRCYEARLGARPGLAGRVVVNFTITRDGSVSEPQVRKSTLGDETAESCMVEAVRGWTFPRPDGGIVIVSYPFELTPGPTQLLHRPDQAITDKLKTYAGDVEECYARHLRVSSPGGKVVFRWTITPQGTVSHVDALGAGMDELEACVAKKIAGARFPRPPGISGPLMVEYPFYFAPGP